MGWAYVGVEHQLCRPLAQRKHATRRVHLVFREKSEDECAHCVHLEPCVARAIEHHSDSNVVPQRGADLWMNSLSQPGYTGDQLKGRLWNTSSCASR